MRALLGAGRLLKSYSCRVRWYCKGKTFLPPKELSEKARKAASLRPGAAKKPETPALEILCRALASSSSAGSASGGKAKEPLTGGSPDQQPTGSSDHSLPDKPPIIPLVAHENIKQDLENLHKFEESLTIDKSGELELFNCKTCHENSSVEDKEENSSVEDQDVCDLMIVNCRISEGDGAILKNETVQGKSYSTGIINNSPKASVSEPQEKPLEKTDTSKPQDKPPVKADAPVNKTPNPESDEPPEIRNDPFSMPLHSAFPLGRNPCIDGKKCECPLPVKPSPCAGEELEDEEDLCAEDEEQTEPQEKPLEKTDTLKPKDKPPVKADAPVKATPNPVSDEPPEIRNDPFSMPLHSAFPLGRNPCRDGKKCKCPLIEKDEMAEEKMSIEPSPCAGEEMEDEEDLWAEDEAQTAKSVSPPVKKEAPPKAASQEKPKVKPPEEAIPDAKKQKAKPRRSPRKAASQSKKWEQPPLPTNSFSFPVLDAFPLGRNPCRDGPRGGEEEECEEECVKCEEESEELPIEETCLSWKEKPKESEKTPCEAENKDISDSPKSSKPPSPPEEIKVSSDPLAPESVLAKPKKAAASAESKPQKEALDTCPSWTDKSKESKKIPYEAKKKDISDSPSPPKEVKSSSDPLASESVLAKPKKAAANAEPKPQKKALQASQKDVAKAKPSSETVPSKKEPKPPKKEPPPRPTSTEEVSSKEEPKPAKKKAPPKPKSSEKSQNAPQLKQFPVAPLEKTLAAYLESIEPFLTPKEFKKEQKLTNEFEDNEGPILQKLLEDAADSCTNWLTPRWTQAAYLAYRAPVTVFSSPGLSFPRQKFATPMECLTFTAKAIHATYEFKELVDENKIPVVKIGDTDLDNSQFGKIFGTVRKPGRCFDTIEQYSKAQYVVVVYKYNFFKLPICSSSGHLLSVTSLRNELEAIVNSPLPRGDPIGLLTHDNRGNWAEAYTALFCPRGNVDSVEAIEQSLFVVCLDDCVPVPKGQASIVQAYQLLHGGGLRQNSANRWMDKTIQLIVNPNGLAGFCYEHSPADCQPLAMLMDFVLEKVKESDCDESDEGENKNPATLLKFRVDDCITLWLHAAMRNIDKIVNVLRMNVFQYQCHGKSFIKAQGLNPDSYIQMALQLAYYNMHKCIPAQYESAHLRIFLNGRTETIRSTSKESKAFVLAMNCEKTCPSDKLTALQNAVDAHEKLIKKALHGEGIDRHLFGLKQMAVEKGLSLPELFQSKGFVRSVTFDLFTSQVATAHESFMAYGPLIRDGYGCCYNPQSDKIIFALSAWQTTPKISPEKYGKAIKKALDSMRKLVLVTGGDRVGEHPCHCKNIST